MTRIAVVGMACRYPDAASPKELWENAIAGRRAFRRLPDERMRLADYYDPDPTVPDRIYAKTAAVIEGYHFDRVKYKIAGSTYRSTDLTHWLALDMAAAALEDAGFPMADGLPKDRTGALVGNTLTGEFSRANVLRLRWPYVRRTVAAALTDQGWDDDRLATFLDNLEQTYKSPFPPIDEDTLAGGLANTIAGRICNYFDLNGGGYTVDGACSSSLLSVVTAAKALGDGDLDVAIAGGVDLSIDPFEIIGFAKTGALAKREMKLYDKDSNGFWPGEGCGMVVLMREEDARREGKRIYATIAGFGISSDGKGGITRPEVSGYQLAMRRAYDRAGFGPDTVAMFEGHGTGTPAGDLVELTALSGARAAADPTAAPAAVSSIKGMIGHTKGAAGVAGLIKAAMAVHKQVLPPTIGTQQPHKVLTEGTPALRVLRKAEPFPTATPVRAAVTAMGFGGINTHIVLENTDGRRRAGLDARTAAIASAIQDAELLLIDAATPERLRERLAELAEFVPVLSYAQLGDLAATLAAQSRDLPYRAALVVSSPEDATKRITALLELIDSGETTHAASDSRTFLGKAVATPSIGYLFPGQGSGKGTGGGALRRRFTEVDAVYSKANLPTDGDMVATAVAQPRIVTGSVAGLRALSALGIDATVGLGHSLGELSALHWAGAIDTDTLLRIAAVRGKAMTEHSSSGTMASVGATAEAVESLLTGLSVVIAGYNGPKQTVVAGPVDEITEVGRRAKLGGLPFTPLPVSHAFHSPLVAPAAESFGNALADETFTPLTRPVESTVTGETLTPDTDIPALLRRQIADPVLFSQAVTRAAKDVDLFIEVGPGRVLTGLAAATTDVPVVALDTDEESVVGLLRVAGAAYVTGVSEVHEALFHGRLVKPLEIGQEFSFFASPAESAPDTATSGGTGKGAATPDPTPTATTAAPEAPAGTGGADDGESVLELLRRLAAERAELPVEMVGDDSLLLDDLHLSSITVGQIVNQAAQKLGLPAANTPTNTATATVAELAQMLAELAETQAGGGSGPAAATVPGAAPWSRPFALDLDELPRPTHTAPEPNGPWQLFAPAGHPVAATLKTRLESAEVGPGVLVVLPDEASETDVVELALAGAKTAAGGKPGTRFVLVQPGRGAAGLAKTLQLEAPQLRVTIVHITPTPETIGEIVAEVAATTDYTEVHHLADGSRRIPTLRALPVRPERTELPLTTGDVLLVTGGGKGITAECALAVAKDTGASLAVLGRSDPAADEELASNLTRMADSGITVSYARADVTDAAAVKRAVDELVGALGPITGVLHGAGRNEPAGITGLDAAAFRRTFAPKIDGVNAVLDAIEPAALKLFVTFGSIIGRAGLRGEGHYSTANEWLADLTVELGERYPDCKALCMEWSVWSGVGMGEKLSVIEALQRDGVTPISPDQGVEIMRRLVADPDTPTVVVISGRTEGIDTVRYDLPQLPFLRFVEKPLIRYHGVELVTEVELSAGTDRYLPDHFLDGNLLFPAVFGMEAMSQVATAVTGRTDLPVITDAEFLRPIVVPPNGTTTIQVAAVVTDTDTVQVVIRSEETGYAAEHFQATLRFGLELTDEGAPAQVGPGLPVVPLDPPTELYGDVLFQGKLFQRLQRYHRSAARHVDADVAVLDDNVGWFAPFLPAELLLGDPGMRDALMHGNQVCVPDATLLPQGIERVHPGGPALLEAAQARGGLRYTATERLRDGDTYLYDIAVRDGDGTILERWDGLRLRAVRKSDGNGPWVAPLLGSYLERTVEDLTGSRIAVSVEPHGDAEPATVVERRAVTQVAAGRAFGHGIEVRYRPDGRPETDGGQSISASHGAGVTVAVAAPGTVGVDVEAVTGRSTEDWQGLLGTHERLVGLVASENDESTDVAATRVWAAIECLQKAGLMPGAPLTVTETQRQGWTVFASGATRVATLATSLKGIEDRVVFAVLSEGR